MGDVQIFKIKFLISLSVLIWLIPMAVYICNAVVKYKKNRRASSSMGKWLMFCSVCFVLSVWCLRFATSYYSEIIVESSGLSGPDMFFDSLLRALQTMTMNESCSEFVVLGKEMVSYLYAGRDVSRIAFVYGIYASSLDLLAPISGGLALFSALAAFFPKIRLRISAFKKQYYFSELNERSLALAKSIVNTEGSFFHRPVLVFTDTYTDEDDEKSSELYAAAKKLGAICINDDLVYLDIRSYKGKEIFLMDDVEGDNIKTLSELSYPANAAMLRNALIYIFYQDDSYALIEKKICDSFSGNADAPIITRVKEYENLILDLLEKKPLVGPLVKNYKDGKTAEYTDKNEYNLTIIGSGIIGMQMLLSSSWCGQFYGYKLNINVVSETEKGKFIDSLNGICPEFIASTQKDNPILKIYKDETPEEKAEREPYFRLRYGEYDFNNISTADIECESISDQEEKPFNILESDYFVIALGSDELNMASAEKLERRLSIVQINPDKPEISSKNRVIAFAVYNQSFCNILKNNNNEFNIDVFPFASIEETYSYQNITMANNDSKAKIVDGTYQKNRSSREEVKAFKDEKREEQKNRNKKIYEIYSSKARSIHFYYRIFSAYLYGRVNHPDTEWKVLNGFDDEAVDAYEKAAILGSPENDLIQYLTWLEHRRWDAYMRSIGFSGREMESKDVNLKIHGCLCECSKEPVDANSEIRINNLKKMLLKAAMSKDEITVAKFEASINSWVRLSEDEQVRADKLKEELNKSFDEICRLKTEGKDVESIIIRCVDSSRKQEGGSYPKPRKSDMLDLASERAGEDKKIYDDPRDGDKERIRAYRNQRA